MRAEQDDALRPKAVANPPRERADVAQPDSAASRLCKECGHAHHYQSLSRLLISL
jgi:hypothetical protein